MLLERASVLLQSPNPNEASGAGFRMHNGSTRLMVVPHLRTKTRAVHPSTLCVWEEKKTPIPPTCHNGNGSERAFVGRSDPHLDRTSICVSQTVPSTTGRIYIYIFNHLHSKKWCAIRHRDCNGKQHQWAANGWMRVRYTGAYLPLQFRQAVTN